MGDACCRYGRFFRYHGKSIGDHVGRGANQLCFEFTPGACRVGFVCANSCYSCRWVVASGQRSDIHWAVLTTSAGPNGRPSKLCRNADHDFSK